jgi:hypothetical protein
MERDPSGKKRSEPKNGGVTRRDFLTTAGVGAAGIAAVGSTVAPAGASAQEILPGDEPGGGIDCLSSLDGRSCMCCATTSP